MTIRHLKIFIAVVENKSITKAARELHLAQPSVTLAIQEIEQYYVLLVDGEIVGCGGINFAENGTIGKISWDMIHPAFQGKSLGTKLLKHRIEVLESISSVEKITVRTSQVAYRFYEKQGFVLNDIKKNYWAEGFDMYSMEYKRILKSNHKAFINP